MALKGPAVSSQEGESAQVFYSSSGKIFSGLNVKQTRNLQLRLEAADGCEILVDQEPKDGRLSLGTRRLEKGKETSRGTS